MQRVTTIGLDIAKSVFQVHGVDAAGNVIIRRQLKRRYVVAFFQKLPPCLVGIEACATSHHWSRELQALGHKVRLMPPAYVKPYVKRQKNDAADAEAICEAVTRSNMRLGCTHRAHHSPDLAPGDSPHRQSAISQARVYVSQRVDCRGDRRKIPPRKASSRGITNSVINGTRRIVSGGDPCICQSICQISIAGPRALMRSKSAGIICKPR
jgi:hypothetical protein